VAPDSWVPHGARNGCADNPADSVLSVGWLFDTARLRAGATGTSVADWDNRFFLRNFRLGLFLAFQECLRQRVHFFNALRRFPKPGLSYQVFLAKIANLTAKKARVASKSFVNDVKLLRGNLS